jgi:hypothetical protein
MSTETVVDRGAFTLLLSPLGWKDLHKTVFGADVLPAVRPQEHR